MKSAITAAFVGVACGLAFILAGCAKSDAHPLKGVVVEVVADPPALVVDHEAIPGFMDAMTMKFATEASTTTAVKAGDHITGRLRYHDGHWRLEDVHVDSSTP